jgi:hypothetical protein
MNQTTNEAADRQEGSASVVGMTVREQLDAFLLGVDTHLSDLRASVVRAEAEADIKRAICAAFPDNLPMAPVSLRVSDGVYKADADLTFEITSRDEALALIDVLPGVTVVMVSAGCTAFVPEERFVSDERGAKVTPVGDVIYRLSSWCEALQEEYSWWTRLSGRLVHVKAKTRKGHRPPVQARASSRNLLLEKVETTWEYAGLPSGELMRWHGGDRSSAVPLTVHQRRGVAFRDAACTTQSATAKVTKNRCDC